MTFSTPIALCFFNRPEPTRQVFEAIARRQPKQLFLIADGPRDGSAADEDLVAKTRSVVEQIDWDCDVQHNYAEANMGCRDRMASGISWAFEQSEELIILEDDCLPNDTFFDYCQNLLNEFRDEPEVMMISGNNFQPCSRTDFSYFFSRYTHNWGWASWRRAWNDYDIDMIDWPAIREFGTMASHFDSESEYEFWQEIFDRQHAGLIDTWDYAWAYACMKQNGLTILPNVNLVSNLGFGAEATHTKDADSPLSMLPSQPMTQLNHPTLVHRHHEADAWTFENIFRPKASVAPTNPPRRLFERLFTPRSRKSA